MQPLQPALLHRQHSCLFFFAPCSMQMKRTTADEDALWQRPAVPLEVILQKLACWVGGDRAGAQGSDRWERIGAPLAEWGRTLPNLACSARRWAFTGGASGLQLGSTAGDMHSCTRLAFGDP